MSLSNLAVQNALSIQDQWASGPLVKVANDALELDGLVTFESDSEERVKLVAEHLAQEIRETLPSTTVVVSWLTPPNGTYLETLARGQKWESKTYLPAANEVPFVRTCDECKQSPASESSENKTIDDDDSRLCRDCYTRSNHDQEWILDRRSYNVRQPPAYTPSRFTAEYRLLRWINAKQLKLDPDGATFDNTPISSWPIKGVVDFNELAAMTRPQQDKQRRRTHIGNHTALFSADGNGLGALFEDARQQAADPGNDYSMGDCKALSKAIKKATENALNLATEAILLTDDEILPAIPHIVGGDDLLVTLPADRAWQFITTFFTTMKSELAVITSIPPGSKPPTVSAGVLFCKAELPFGDQVEMAEALQREAKKHVKGNSWSFAWSDVTIDGLDGRRTPWCLFTAEKVDKYVLEELKPALNHTRDRNKLPASAESELLTALNDPSIVAARQKIAHRVHRMEGAREFLKVCGVDPNNFSKDDVELVNDITAMGRWWR